MSQADLKQCVEVFGEDASLSSEQRRSLWVKLRKVSDVLASQAKRLGVWIVCMMASFLTGAYDVVLFI